MHELRIDNLDGVYSGVIFFSFNLSSLFIFSLFVRYEQYQNLNLGIQIVSIYSRLHVNNF